MPWQNQGGGGGPWGSGGGGQGPWGRGPGGQRPPDFEELLRRGQDRMKRFVPGGVGGGRNFMFIAIIGLLVWLVWGGLYTVQPDELGVPLIFGKAQDPTLPGWHWNFPAPIGHVEKPKVTVVNRTEVGLRSSASGSAPSDLLAESLMLTGDENIIDIQFTVQWLIDRDNVFLYLFNIRDPEATIKNVSEAAMREIVGQTPFEYALTRGRAEIADRTHELIQSILNSYGAGIIVTEVALQKVDPPLAVVESFRDVQAARADQVRAVNDAQGYYNQVTQRAQGEAQQIIKEAEAYKEQKIAVATGDAQRFLSVYDEYVLSKDVTRRRIYLETMERVMRGMEKVLIEGSVGAGAVPYLPLNELLRRPPQAGQRAPEPAQGASQ